MADYDEIVQHIRQMKEQEAELFKKKSALEDDLESLKSQAKIHRNEVDDLQALKAKLEKAVADMRVTLRDDDAEFEELEIQIQEQKQKLEEMKTQTAVANALQKSAVERLEADKRLDELIEHYIHLDDEFPRRFILGLGYKKVRDADGNVIGKKAIYDIFLESAAREEQRLKLEARAYVRRGNTGGVTAATKLGPLRRLPKVSENMDAMDSEKAAGESSPAMP